VLGPLSLGRMVLNLSGVPSSPHVEWVVLLEAAADANAMLIDRGTIDAMVRTLEDDSAVALHSADRLAIQLKILESDMETAFAAAMRRWRRAARPLIPRGWSLVRGEIVTREEFDRESDQAQ
jgi:hypothetical protein